MGKKSVSFLAIPEGAMGKRRNRTAAGRQAEAAGSGMKPQAGGKQAEGKAGDKAARQALPPTLPANLFGLPNRQGCSGLRPDSALAGLPPWGGRARGRPQCPPAGRRGARTPSHKKSRCRAFEFTMPLRCGLSLPFFAPSFDRTRVLVSFWGHLPSECI